MVVLLIDEDHSGPSTAATAATAASRVKSVKHYNSIHEFLQEEGICVLCVSYIHDFII